MSLGSLSFWSSLLSKSVAEESQLAIYLGTYPWLIYCSAHVKTHVPKSGFFGGALVSNYLTFGLLG
jgi:hypothetical protein